MTVHTPQKVPQRIVLAVVGLVIVLLSEPRTTGALLLAAGVAVLIGSSCREPAG